MILRPHLQRRKKPSIFARPPKKNLKNLDCSKGFMKTTLLGKTYVCVNNIQSCNYEHIIFISEPNVTIIACFNAKSWDEELPV